MSLTHKALSAMGIEPEKIEQILEMHRETLDSIKADKDKALQEVETLKAEAEKVTNLEKELSKLKDASEKYTSLKEEYDKYKTDVTAKETKAAKTKAYRDMLKEIGVSDKYFDDVIRIADIDSIELDEHGAIKDVEGLKTSAKDKWKPYIFSEEKKGAETPTPPSNTGGTKTKKEIMQIKDYDERQKAIAENHQLFGF